jgi:hypothetical protein
MALNWDQITGITSKYFIPKLVDNIFTSNPVLFRLYKKGMKLTGGTKILAPVIYAATSAAGSYTGSGALTITDNEQITSAEFDWKQYYANITITGLDELKNSGKEAIINFVKSKVQIAEMSLKSAMGTDLYGDGTGGTNTALTGLKLAVDSTGTYGTIARGTYTWWAAQEDSTTTTTSTANMQTMWGLCSIDNDVPTIITTTQSIFNRFFNELTPQQRYTSDDDIGKAGFKNLMFNSAPVVVDSKCDANYMYFLNENYLELATHKDCNFRFEPFIKPTDSDVKIAKIFWAGNLVCSNCRMQGKFTGLTA